VLISAWNFLLLLGLSLGGGSLLLHSLLHLALLALLAILSLQDLFLKRNLSLISRLSLGSLNLGSGFRFGGLLLLFRYKLLLVCLCLPSGDSFLFFGSLLLSNSSDFSCCCSSCLLLCLGDLFLSSRFVGLGRLHRCPLDSLGLFLELLGGCLS